MKKKKDDDRIVYQSLAMIMQFGLNMIVPICMMSALGIWLDRKLETSFLTVVLFAVGAVAGGQNIYRMARRMCREEGQEAEKGSAGKDGIRESHAGEGSAGKDSIRESHAGEDSIRRDDSTAPVPAADRQVSGDAKSDGQTEKNE